MPIIPSSIYPDSPPGGPSADPAGDSWAHLDSSKKSLLLHLRELGAFSRTVEFAPYVMLRKAGRPTTIESAADVQDDLTALETERHVLTGEATANGVMVMLISVIDMPVPLTCDRLVALYGWMNEHERAMLSRWEARNLLPNGPHTSDWPGWATIYRRRN